MWGKLGNSPIVNNRPFNMSYHFNIKNDTSGVIGGDLAILRDNNGVHFEVMVRGYDSKAMTITSQSNQKYCIDDELAGQPEYCYLAKLNGFTIDHYQTEEMYLSSATVETYWLKKKLEAAEGEVIMLKQKIKMESESHG